MQLFLIVVLCLVLVAVDAFRPLAMRARANANAVTTTTSSTQTRTHTRLAARREEEYRSNMKGGGGIDRSVDSEGEFFESEFDRTPFKERLPVALGFLAAVSLPFIIGLVYLYTNK